MKISKKVLKAIKDSGTVCEGCTVVVGLSGGPDSMCLLHALSELGKLMPMRLVAAHVNHKLRENADAEAAKAKEFCDELGVEFRELSVDCETLAKENGISTEESGRIARYSFFDELADELAGEPSNDVRIAVAHNADDQAETVLFRLIRGTGIHGAAGMRAVRSSEKGYKIVRPLLAVSRADIEKYIAENELKPNHDESNDVPDVSRNKIRLELLPYLEKNFNPSIKEALVRFAELARQEDDFLEAETVGLENLGVQEMRGLNNALKTRLIARLLDEAGLHEGVTGEHISAVVELINSENPSACIDLPHGVIAAREYDKLVIGHRDKALGQKPELERKLKCRVMEVAEYRKLEKSGSYVAFDYDAINAKYPGNTEAPVLRTRREGDFLAIKGGRKKLQDYLVDAKIKKNDRDNVAIVAVESEVLWVIDTNRISHNFQIDDTSQRVIFLELEQ